MTVWEFLDNWFLLLVIDFNVLFFLTILMIAGVIVNIMQVRDGQ